MTRQLHLPLPNKEAMGLEDFLPAPSNERGVHWLLQTETHDWPSHTLILWGPEGSGKTHLLSIWTSHKNAALILPKADVIDAIIDGKGAQAYAIDGADSIAGDSEAEEWLQHFYNATKAAGTPVLLTATKPPSAWGIKLPDILTRLKSCEAVQLQEPDDELIHGLLMKLFQDRQLHIDMGVIAYMAPRLERTGDAIRSAVTKLDVASLEGHRKISIPFVQKTLGW